MAAVVSMEQVRGRYRTRSMAKKNTPAKVIAITSGKGGVGKTHTSVNLGMALAKEGKRVLLLDADLGLANINILLGFKPKATLHEMMTGRCSIRDIIVNYANKIDIIPASSGIAELTNLSDDERMSLLAAIDEFAFEYDYVLVDTAAGIGDNVLYFNVAAEEVLVVVDPEPTSITDAYALMKVLSTKHGVKKFSVLVNRSPKGTDGRATFAQLSAVSDRFLQVHLSFLGNIPEDSSIVEAVLKQRPCFELFPSSPASLGYQRLAKRILAEETAREPRGGLQFFFRSLIENE